MKPRRFHRLFVVATLSAVASSGPAQAHYVADELTFGVTPPTSSTPQTVFVSDKFSGRWDANDKLQLKLDVTYTYDAPSAPPASAHFSTTADNILALQLSASWDFKPHWNLYVAATGSLPSQSKSDATLQFLDDSTIGCKGASPPKACTKQMDSQLLSKNWTAGGAFTIGYDTSSDDEDHKFDTAADLGVSLTWYDTLQRFTDFYIADKQYTEPQLVSYCMAHPKLCPQQFKTVLNAGPEAAEFGQINLSAVLTETLFQNTDIGLAGAYYLYTQDPTTVGYFSLTTLGRGEANSGGGVPIAPYLWTVSPDIAQRYKGFSADLSFQFGQYVSDNLFSYDLTLGLKLQYKISRTWRVWIKGSAQRDIDSSGELSYAGTASVGTRLSW